MKRLSIVLALLPFTHAFQEQSNHKVRGARMHNKSLSTHNNISSTATRCMSTTVMDGKSDRSENCKIISWPDGTKQSRESLEQDMYSFLYTNMFPFDRVNAESLGFHSASSDTLPDGLSNGLIKPSIDLSIDAKVKYTWTSHVPKDIYFEYVTPYACVNEPRNNWRPVFYQKLKGIVEDFVSKNETIMVEDVLKEINQNMWDKFGNDEPIYFKSGQTPLIMDAMSVIVYGYASCTGLSIFLINALRIFGIPCRLAGTAAWNAKTENGNHSWIEFYGSDQQWHIMESKPASNGNDENLLEPCQWWFCNEERVKDTSFFSAGFDQSHTTSFPMAWEESMDDIPGEDRTQFMRDICSKC